MPATCMTTLGAGREALLAEPTHVAHEKQALHVAGEQKQSLDFRLSISSQRTPFLPLF